MAPSDDGVDFLQINSTFFSSFFHRRIQSQHNLLEKELAEHTIDFLKSSNIRIIEKVSKNYELEKIALHNAAGPTSSRLKFVVYMQLFSLFVLILPSPSRRHLREWHTEQRRVYAMMIIKKSTLLRMHTGYRARKGREGSAKKDIFPPPSSSQSQSNLYTIAFTVQFRASFVFNSISE